MLKSIVVFKKNTPMFLVFLAEGNKIPELSRSNGNFPSAATKST